MPLEFKLHDKALFSDNSISPMDSRKLKGLGYNQEASIEEKYILADDSYKGPLRIEISNSDQIPIDITETPKGMSQIDGDVEGEVSWSPDDPLVLEYNVSFHPDEVDSILKDEIEAFNPENLEKLLGEDFRQVSEEELLSRIGDRFEYEWKDKTHEEFISEKTGKCDHFASLFAYTLKERGEHSAVREGFGVPPVDTPTSEGEVNINQSHAWVDKPKDDGKIYDPTTAINLPPGYESALIDLPKDSYFITVPERSIETEEFTSEDYGTVSKILNPN